MTSSATEGETDKRGTFVSPQCCSQSHACPHVATGLDPDAT